MENDKDGNGFKISIDGFDPLGLKSAGEISKIVVQFGLDGAKEFLKLTCKELGQGLRDKYTNWRLLNIIKMLELAKGKLRYDPEKEKITIDPRVAFQIVEHSSVVSDNILQDMWAGLFAASCSRYEEDENILFIDLLKRLTSSQVKLLVYLCEKSKKDFNIAKLPEALEEGLVSTAPVSLSYETILEVMGTTNKLKADTEFSALENMGLIAHRDSFSLGVPLITRIKSINGSRPLPTLMAIRLFVKCHGISDNPSKYFLPEINNEYYELVKDFIPVDKENTLNFLYQKVMEGKVYEKDIEYGNEIKINNDEWSELREEEISRRLRLWLIFRYVKGISRSFTVVQGMNPIGNFSYKNGFKKSVYVNS